MVGGRRPGNQLAGRCIDGEFSLGHHGLQPLDCRGGRDAADRVAAELRLLGSRDRPGQLLERFGQAVVIGGHRPGDQLAGRCIDRELGLGDHRLQLLDRRRGRDAADCVAAELLLLVGRRLPFEFLKRLLDLGELGRVRPQQQPISAGILNDLELRVELLDDGEGLRGRCSIERVGEQPVLFLFGYFMLEFLQQLRQHGVLLRLRPDRQFAGLRLRDDPDPGQVRRQIRKNGLKSRALRRRHRIELERVAHSRSCRLLQLLDGLLYQILVRRGGDNEQPRTIGRHGDLGCRYERLQHGGEIRRRRFTQRVDAQYR